MTVITIIEIRNRILVIDKNTRRSLSLIKLRGNIISRFKIQGTKTKTAMDSDGESVKSNQHPYATVRNRELPVISGEYLDNISNIATNIQKIGIKLRHQPTESTFMIRLFHHFNNLDYICFV